MNAPVPRLRPGVAVLLATLLILLPSGCGVLKPTTMATRSFVLNPLAPGAAGNTAGVTGNPGVGLALVKFPPYLLKPSLAVRPSSNEVAYLDNALWAEPLDRGFQRVLGANLAALLPTDRIQFSSWRRAEVAAIVQVTVGQFDVDAAGRGTLHAWWQITDPSGEKVLRSGEGHFNREASASADPAAIATALSDLAADLARALATALAPHLQGVPARP